MKYVDGTGGGDAFSAGFHFGVGRRARCGGLCGARNGTGGSCVQERGATEGCGVGKSWRAFSPIGRWIFVGFEDSMIGRGSGCRPKTPSDESHRVKKRIADEFRMT